MKKLYFLLCVIAFLIQACAEACIGAAAGAGSYYGTNKANVDECIRKCKATGKTDYQCEKDCK